jgi:hypothetical protein
MTNVDTSARNVNLIDGEPHPSYINALAFIRSIPIDELNLWQESFASCAIEGNRLGEICGETLRRLLAGELVSDRYLMGLAIAIGRLERE